MITTSPNKLYKATLDSSNPTAQYILDLDSAASGLVYNGVTDEIIWGEGYYIMKMSATSSSPYANNGK